MSGGGGSRPWSASIIVRFTLRISDGRPRSAFARSHRCEAAPGVAGARTRLSQRASLSPAVRIPSRAFAVGGGPRAWTRTGDAADRKARGHDHDGGAGRALRPSTHVFGRSFDRHLFLGISV